MNIRAKLLAGAASIALGASGAMAADLNKGGSIKDSGYMPAIQQPQAAGLYLRGDFTWSHQSIGGMSEPPAYELTQISVGSARSWGLGVGYYASKNVRADITVDMRGDSHLRGSVLDGHATVQGERQFGFKSLAILGNVYYDFDTRSHFTPYIGVGLGAARTRTKSGTVAIAYNPGYACTDVTVATCAAEFDGATEWNAAGAIMAGFSAKLHSRLHLDAGYRFLYLGNAHTGDIRTRSTNVATGVVTHGAAADPIVHDISAHEFRVGLRWDINR